MKKILITGCNGFVGKHTVRFFSQKPSCKVYATDIVGDAPENTVFLGGALTPELLAGFGTDFDAVIHCAGTGTVGKAAADPQESYKNTVGTTEYILDFIRHSPDTMLIYLSSAAVYGNEYQSLVPEDAPLSPMSNYGRDKVYVEELLEKYHRAYGCKVNIVRFFSIYGEELRKQLLWDFSNRLHQAMQKNAGSVPCFGTGDEARDFIHVADGVRLFELLIERDEDWQVVNAGTGVVTTVREILEKICSEFGFTGSLDFNGEVRPGDPAILAADTSRQSSIGFKPQIDVAAGVREYVSWFKEEIRKGNVL